MSDTLQELTSGGKVRVGDQLFRVLPSGRRAAGTGWVVVVRVGRQYFDVAPVRKTPTRYNTTTHYANTWTERTDSNAYATLYVSEDEYVKRLKRRHLVQLIRQEFQSPPGPSITLQELGQIAAILGLLADETYQYERSETEDDNA